MTMVRSKLVDPAVTRYYHCISRFVASACEVCYNGRMSTTNSISETDILSDVIAPDQGNLPPDVARSLLEWKFSESACARMRELADRKNKGTISDDEQDELEKYVRVGGFVNLVQAKARVSIAQHSTD